MSFDRSLLPPAQLELAVFGDTHFILDTEAYAVEFDSVRQWPARADYAVRRTAELAADLVIHLGDLSEEPPAHADHAASRDTGLGSLRAAGLSDAVFVPGNMDIGDKPDPTMWTPPVSDATLSWFHERFGPSWHSFDIGDCHLVFLNSQILNGSLDAAAGQARWLEQDLARHHGQRILLFLHMPPFFVADDEPDTGFYNSIDEPARSWLTGLLRQHSVEAVFCGHTHFRALNRAGDTRVYVCPSTTTSRAGFYEAFTVAPPPESGRNDPDKLGLCLVRLLDDGTRVHFVRTAGRTHGDFDGWSDVLTPTSHDLPSSPLGLYLRTPLAVEAAGALAWPSVKRQRVRDDHPLLHAIELGARHVRVPVSDLHDPLQSQRLHVLRDEGVSITATVVVSPTSDWLPSVQDTPWWPDTVELQLPRQELPDDTTLSAMARLRHERPSLDISIAPLLPMQRADGRYHPRARLGYTPDEVRRLDARLAESGLAPPHVVAWLDPALDTTRALAAFDEACRLPTIGGLDVVLALAEEGAERTEAICQALTAAALRPGMRLFLDPFVDLDRTNDVATGLLDRLGNPRPSFHAVRTLNALLHTRSGWRAEADSLIAADGTRLTVRPAGGPVPVAGRCYDLCRCRSLDVDAGFIPDVAGGWALLSCRTPSTN